MVVNHAQEHGERSGMALYIAASLFSLLEGFLVFLICVKILFS